MKVTSFECSCNEISFICNSSEFISWCSLTRHHQTSQQLPMHTHSLHVSGSSPYMTTRIIENLLVILDILLFTLVGSYCSFVGVNRSFMGVSRSFMGVSRTRVERPVFNILTFWGAYKTAGGRRRLTSRSTTTYRQLQLPAQLVFNLHTPEQRWTYRTLELPQTVKTYCSQPLSLLQP